jgi:copper resistance protein B
VKFCSIPLAIFLAVSSHPAYAGMEDDPTLSSVIFNQFEVTDDKENTAIVDMDAWVGKDLNKFWIKSEAERTDGDLEESDLQMLYSRGFARYWDVQVGLKHDFNPSPSRTWAVFGIQGLAPYFFETDMALFVGENGRTAFSFEYERELLFTQKLILTPEVEVNFYGKDDPEIGIGSGLSNMDLRLRLRYEFRREFAPYIGITYSRKYGNTADFARSAGENDSNTQITLGIRLWL